MQPLHPYSSEDMQKNVSLTAEEYSNRQRVRLLCAFLIVVVLILGAYFYWVSKELDRISQPSILTSGAKESNTKLVALNTPARKEEQSARLAASQPTASIKKTASLPSSSILSGKADGQIALPADVIKVEEAKSFTKSSSQDLKVPMAKAKTSTPEEVVSPFNLPNLSKGMARASLPLVDKEFSVGLVTVAEQKEDKKEARAFQKNPLIEEAHSKPIQIHKESSRPSLEWMAYHYLEEEQWQASREAYGRLLKEQPDSREARLGLAYIDVQKAKNSKAVQHDHQLLEEEPQAQESPKEFIEMAQTADTEGDQEEKVSQEDFSTLGFRASQQKNWKSAYAYFRKALEGTGSAEIAYNTAIAADHLGHFQDALSYYKEALSLEQEQGASFDKHAVVKRVRMLQGSSGGTESAENTTMSNLASLPASE